MPLFNVNRSILFCKLLRPREFPHLQAIGFSELDEIFDVKNRFSITPADVNMDRMVVVALECESTTVFLENLRHFPKLVPEPKRSDIFLPIVRGDLPGTADARDAVKPASQVTAVKSLVDRSDWHFVFCQSRLRLSR